MSLFSTGCNFPGHVRSARKLGPLVEMRCLSTIAEAKNTVLLNSGTARTATSPNKRVSGYLAPLMVANHSNGTFCRHEPGFMRSSIVFGTLPQTRLLPRQTAPDRPQKVVHLGHAEQTGAPKESDGRSRDDPSEFHAQKQLSIAFGL